MTRAELAGPGAALITLCLLSPREGFRAAAVVEVFMSALARTLHQHGCRAPAYCFMPNHLHLLVEGVGAEADMWLALVHFKRVTGAWLEQHRRIGQWQSGFDARPKDPTTSLRRAAEYVINNPVRAGLVRDWRDYPFTGSVDEHGVLGAPML